MTELDRREIRELWDVMSRRMFSHAMVISGGDKAASEDAVLDAFKALVSQWLRLRGLPLDAQRAWLVRVMTNQLISAYRKEARFVTVDPADHGVLDRIGSGKSPFQEMLSKDLLDRCLRVIGAMPPVRRLVISLRAYEYTTTEIAALLGINECTVRGHRAKALRELREKVGNVIEILDGAGDEPVGEELT